MSSAQQEFRQQLFGVDVDPEAFFQNEQRWKEDMEESARQAAKNKQIITELRQQHQGISTTINTLVPPQPDFNMDSPEDIMSVNPFEGIFSSASSSNQLPVKVLVDKIEKGKERTKEAFKTQ